MDLRFCVTHPPVPDGSSYKWKSVCAVSCESIVAFSRVRVVTSEGSSKVLHCVSAADFNSPHLSSDIAVCFDPIQLLQFSNNGKQLLVITSAGNIRLLQQVSGALQPDWTVAAETTVKSETVLAAAFLHSGLKPHVNLGDVKVNSLYHEKFSLQKHTPSLMAPGACPTEGIIAVTASGLVLVMALWREGVVEVKRKVLGSTRGHYTSVDIALAPDGSISVCAWQPDVVRCWCLTLAHADVLLAEAATHSPLHNNNNTIDVSGSETQKLCVSIAGCESVCPYRPVSADSGKRPAGCKEDSAAAMGPMRELHPECYRVSGVHFPYREDPSVLLLVLVERPPAQKDGALASDHLDKNKLAQSRPHTSIVQKYRLEEKSQSSFKLFKTSDNSSTSGHTAGAVTYKVWCLVGEWCSPGGGVVTLGSCPRYLIHSSQLPHLITAATEDGNITSINLNTMMPVASCNLNTVRNSDHGAGDNGGPSSSSTSSVGGAKRPGGGATGSSGGPGGGSSGGGGGGSGGPGGLSGALSLGGGRFQRSVSLSHTWTGLSVVSYDSDGSLCLFSLVKPADVGHPWPLCVLLLLEYSVVAGHDWWELLIITPSSSVTTVVDRLMDTLSQHSPAIHTQYQNRMLLLRYSILRLSHNTQSRSVEAMIQARLAAILSLFRQFRPLTPDCSPDKCASNLLTAYMENRNSLEQLDLDKSVDQFLFSVNQSLDCQVDIRSRRFLRPLLQHTTEICLFLLFSIAQTNKNEVLRDVKTLQMLREVLFRARVWWHYNKLIAPTVTRKTDSVDVWAQLFRLLTRLLTSLPGEPDATFLDEVLLLETQVLCHSMCLTQSARGFLTTLHNTPLPAPGPAHHPIPVQYQHCDHEEPPPCSGLLLEGALPAFNPRDPLFLHFIPEDAPKLQCTRCWSERTSAHDPENPWEQLWAGRCLCSGHWMPRPLCEAPPHLRT